MEEDGLSDEFLIDAIAGGGMWAIERLYDRYGKRFYALAYRMTADHMVSEELVQDAFLSVWQSASSYVPQTGPARNWLFSIIYHRTLSYLRSVRLRSTFQQVPLQEIEAFERFVLSDVWDQVWSAAQNAELHACLMQLPAEQREVIELAYFWGWTHTEIAQRRQLPLGTVKARLRLGVLHLRRAFEQSGGEKLLPSDTSHGHVKAKQVATVIQATEIGCAAGYELYREGTVTCFGYSEWERIIEQIETFEFRGVAGSFIARKERRIRGHAYWYAYIWGSAGRRKAYLGRTTQLTLPCLEAMARKLHEVERGESP